MLTSKGPHVSLSWVTPALLAFSALASFVAALCFGIPLSQAVALFLNMTGTILLASAFEAAIPKHGDDGLWDSLRFAIRELPNYGSAPSFSIARFHSGLLILLAGMVLGAVVQ